MTRSGPTSRAPVGVRRSAWFLLVLMTLGAFGGPVVIGLVLRGGARPNWPPDRPVEWATLFGVSALVLALMILAIALSVANQRAAARLRAAGRDTIDGDAPRPS